MTSDYTDINLYFTKDEKLNLIITNDMYKEIVELYSVKIDPPSRMLRPLLEKLSEEREARKLVNEEFKLLAHPRNLIKIIAKLIDKKFEPQDFKDGYEIIKKFYSHKEVFYSPKTKEIWSSNKRFDNQTIKRMGHLYTLGDYYLRREFDKALDELFNEYILATGLEKDYNYSSFFDRDFYCIKFEELESYCKLFSHINSEVLENENLY